MNQSLPTSNNVTKDKTDTLNEASAKAEKAVQIDDNQVPASASKNNSYEEYRAEIFGNKLRAARHR